MELVASSRLRSCEPTNAGSWLSVKFMGTGYDHIFWSSTFTRTATLTAVRPSCRLAGSRYEQASDPLMAVEVLNELLGTYINEVRTRSRGGIRQKKTGSH